MEDVSDLKYHGDDKFKPLLIKEASAIAEDRLRIGKTLFNRHVRPLLNPQPILFEGRALRVRKGEIVTLCNMLLNLGPEQTVEIVEEQGVPWR